MKADLNIFVDPKTKKPLKLSIKELKNGHVIKGALYCQNNSFPIVKGIPRFVKFLESIGKNANREKQTANSFGIKWNETRHQKLGFTKQDIGSLREQFLALLGCHTVREVKSLFKKSKRSLNAGCGVAWSEYLFNYNPRVERHCVDISSAVDTAYKKTSHLVNVIVSQSSIFNMPYKDSSFDIVYSLGVIHHTPDPKLAFRELVKKLMPGGLIGIYIYNKKPFIRELVDVSLRGVTTKMSYRKCLEFSEQMTMLGEALKNIHSPLIISKDIPLLGIKKGKYNLQKFVYDHFIKCWYNPFQDKKYADLVNLDWYHPFYASHHSREEIMQWFKEFGIGKIKFIQPKGWEYSGFFVSGIKK